MNISEVIARIDSEPNVVVLELCNIITKDIDNNATVTNSGYIVNINTTEESAFYERIIELYTIVISIFKSGKAKTGEAMAKLVGGVKGDLTSIYQYVEKLKPTFQKKVTEEKINSIADKYANMMETGFAYHFSDDEVEKIQKLINILRSEITESKSFEDEHKFRLLKRLEKLQSEIHKEMSDLDRFWGLVGDAGVAIGKFGKDVKPIVDRIRELTDIVWKAQRRSEQLPHDSSSHPLIEDQEAV